jgi:hypothetical protein
VGGSLPDPLHYDENSVITIVALLSDDNGNLEGGVFRTNESDGSMLEHVLHVGDAAAFVSHKYHNISKVLQGSRQSLVIELWQGNNSHGGR